VAIGPSAQVADEELANFYRMITEHVVLTDPQAGVADFSAVSSFDVSVERIRMLAKMAPAMPQTSRPRVVVAPSDHIYGMMRMFKSEGKASRPNLHVVRTLDEARAILGVQNPQFELLDRD